MSAATEDLIVDSGRFEFKYRISYHHYLVVKNQIAPYMKKDYFTRIAPGNRYFVRSLYYETDAYHIYREKMAGDGNRVKFRLRSYSDKYDKDTLIRAELKVRRGETMAKYQTFASYPSYENFIKKGHWLEHSDPVLEEFERGIILRSLQPKVLIDYHREGFESRSKDGVRLTFDHQVRSAQEKCLFPTQRPFFRVHHDNEVVLEIKFKKTPDLWLKTIIHSCGLRLVANSKYTQGIEVARRDQHYRNGIVIVR